MWTSRKTVTFTGDSKHVCGPDWPSFENQNSTTPHKMNERSREVFFCFFLQCIHHQLVWSVVRQLLHTKEWVLFSSGRDGYRCHRYRCGAIVSIRFRTHAFMFSTVISGSPAAAEITEGFGMEHTQKYHILVSFDTFDMWFNLMLEHKQTPLTGNLKKGKKIRSSSSTRGSTGRALSSLDSNKTDLADIFLGIKPEPLASSWRPLSNFSYLGWILEQTTKGKAPFLQLIIRGRLWRVR